MFRSRDGALRACCSHPSRREHSSAQRHDTQCAGCNANEYNRDNVMDEIHQKVVVNRDVMFIAVGASPNGNGAFAYTIGMGYNHNLPELFLACGCGQVKTGQMLGSFTTDLTKRPAADFDRFALIDAIKIKNPASDDTADSDTMVLSEISAKLGCRRIVGSELDQFVIEFMGLANLFYRSVNKRFEVRQLILPDTRGLLPWDANADAEFHANQAILYDVNETESDVQQREAPAAPLAE